MKITAARLRKAGFTQVDLGDEVPYEEFHKSGVEVWDFNGMYWIVDALDQGGIHVEFHTMEHLNEFFIACRLPVFLPKPDDGQRCQVI